MKKSLPGPPEIWPNTILMSGRRIPLLARLQRTVGR